MENNIKPKRNHTSYTFIKMKKLFSSKLSFAVLAALSMSVTSSAATWIWYPGQLAAYGQKVQLRKSAARCVNVGYPGNFEPTRKVTYFKGKDGVVRKETADAGMPALWVDSPEEWQVSIDGKNWNIPEYDISYADRNVRPDADREQVVTVFMGQGRATSDRPFVVDFGVLEVGSVKLRARGTGKLEFIVGECREEALCKDKSTFEQRPIPEVTLTGEWKDIELPERAVRYLAIFGDAEIDSLRFDTQMWQVKRKMTFHCSDSLLNRLFEAGVATLHTSMHRFYLDGVKRDYLPWAMDAVISQLGGDYVFGDRQVARNGIALSLMPANPSEKDWGIVDYPLHALIGLKQDYLRYGDRSTIDMYRDRILAQLDLYESLQDEKGFIHAPKKSAGFIPGWSRDMGPGDYGVAAYAQMMLYENFRIAAYFAGLWGDKELQKHYRLKAVALGSAIRSCFWDNDKKAFINGLYPDGRKDERISHHAQYWSVLTDLYPTELYGTLFDRVIPSISYYKKNISYEKGYEALAYQKAGRMADYRRLIADVWGDWLNAGNLRFPENFSWGADFAKQHAFYGRQYGLSLCHGANGVPPILVALRGVFGFDVRDDGSYVLNPDLMGLKYAEGEFPVKEGIIRISLSSDGTWWAIVPDNAKVQAGGKLKVYKESAGFRPKPRRK